jgi:hypothetical protein
MSNARLRSIVDGYIASGDLWAMLSRINADYEAQEAEIDKERQAAFDFFEEVRARIASRRGHTFRGIMFPTRHTRTHTRAHTQTALWPH